MGDGLMRCRPFTQNRIGIRHRDFAELGDIVIKPHMHQAVFLIGVHFAGFHFPRLQRSHGFRLRYLIDQDLVFPERYFGDAVPGCG